MSNDRVLSDPLKSYVDPYGSRAEWEGKCICMDLRGYHDDHHTGFVAIVDKEMSAKYEKLVNDAPRLIKDLPWGPDFEVDVFRKPDFTALQIVSFATGGIPAGINVCDPHSSGGVVLIWFGRSPITTRFANPWDSRMSHSLSVPVSFLDGVLRLTSEIEYLGSKGSR